MNESYLNTAANKLAQEVGLDPIMIITVLMGLFSCLKNDDDKPTPEAQIAHAKEQVNQNERRVLRVARRHARQAGVPRDKIYRTAAAVVNTIKMSNDAELKESFKEMEARQSV